MINELIEQIGGRERLEEMSQCSDVTKLFAYEMRHMARALLAVLDAKSVGMVSIVQDLYSIPRRNIATVNMRPDLVLTEMRDGDNLYTVPPAASAHDGWKLVPLEPHWSMIDAAIKHHEGEAFLPVSLYKAMLAAAPAPGGDGGDQS